MAYNEDEVNLMIDLNKARQVFNQYVQNYNSEDGKIALKISHTYRVMARCQEIAESLKLSDEDVKLASLIGLLHDIGRFEQLKRYNSFIDSQTVDHGNLGASILFDEGLIDRFDVDLKYYPLIKTAIINHNKYEIEPNLDKRTYLHCQIIRDGDKVDIFKTGLIEPIEVFLGDVSKENLENDTISDAVYQNFIAGKTVLSTLRKTSLDRWVSFLALVFGLNFSYSYQYIAKHHYLERLFIKIECKNLDTKAKMDELKKYSLAFLNKQIKE